MSSIGLGMPLWHMGRETGASLNKRARIAAIVAVGAAVAATATAWASETITYKYDARGRLIKVERTGTVNNNVKAEYKYDKADNRINVNVTSPNPPP